MLSAQTVANYFLWIQSEEDNDLSNLKLQKLLYYAQGFALAILGKPLFEEAVVAWAHGPVVPEVYFYFRDNSADPISPLGSFDESVLAPDEKRLLDEVWEVYGQFSAYALRNFTHDEPPWRDTPRNEEITHAAMLKYFKTLIRTVDE